MSEEEKSNNIFAPNFKWATLSSLKLGNIIAFDEVRGDAWNPLGNQRQGQILDVFFFQGQDKNTDTNADTNTDTI